MKVRSRWSRPLLGVVGAGVGAILLVALASALADSLAIAEQPGRSIGVPAVAVQPTGTSTAEPVVTPSPTPSTEPTAPSTTTPEVVPAQELVVVDDHGGDNPSHDDDSGSDDSGGDSGSGRKGSGSSDG